MLFEQKFKPYFENNPVLIAELKRFGKKVQMKKPQGGDKKQGVAKDAEEAKQVEEEFTYFDYEGDNPEEEAFEREEEKVEEKDPDPEFDELMKMASSRTQDEIQMEEDLRLSLWEGSRLTASLGIMPSSVPDN